MQRPLLGALVCFAFAVGIAVSAPARPLYEPEPPPKAPKGIIIDLKGTVWLGKYSTTPRTFIFEADGTVSYRSGAVKGKAGIGGIKNRGFWKLQGDVLYFEHFIKQGATIMEFKGTIRDPNAIVGESWNKAGVKTQQTLQRVIE